jgi:hypothetical protein
MYTSYGCPVVYLCCDEGQGMEFNLTLKSSREPASTTEDGTRFHSLMDLGKKECWYVSLALTPYLLTLPLFAGVSRVRALSPAWTGSHALETLISRTHLFLPHDIPPTKNQIQ